MNIKIIVGLVVVLILGYAGASPYITAYRMKNAADSQDKDTLVKLIDFPALQGSLREQMKVVLDKEMAKDEIKNSQFAAYGNTFGGIMVAEIVDAYVTPDNITELVRGDVSMTDLPVAELMKGEKSISEIMDQKKAASASSAGSEASSNLSSDASMSYESLSEFSITTVDSDSDRETKFILSRRGIGWKLTGVRLPL